MKKDTNIVIGEWINTMEGFAIARKKHDYYWEEYDYEVYECPPERKELGGHKHSLLEYTLFCDYDGKPIKRNRHSCLNADYCYRVTPKYQKILNKSIKNNPKEYASFLKALKTSRGLTSSCRLVYEISQENKNQMELDIKKIKDELPSEFTIQDVLNIARKNECIVDLTKFERTAYCYDVLLDIMLLFRIGNFSGNRVLFHEFMYEIWESPNRRL